MAIRNSAVRFAGVSPLGLFFALTAVAQTHGHPPAAITGANIQLFERDHAFAGELLKVPVFGQFDHDPLGGRLVLRKGEETLTLILGQEKDPAGNDHYQGKIQEILKSGGSSSVRMTQVELLYAKKLNSTSARILLLIDGTEVPVEVSANRYEQGHFIAPRFEFDLSGQKVTLQFTGEACMGYASNMALLIVSGYAHLNKK